MQQGPKRERAKVKRFSQSLFGSVTRLSFICTLIASAVAVLFGHAHWLTGLWASFGWLFLNSFLVYYLLELVAEQGNRNRGKLSIIFLIKFPVLYLMGFGLLISPLISNYGILTGFTAYLLAGILIALRKNFIHAQKA